MDNDIRKGTLSPQLLKPIHPVHHLFTRVLASKPLQAILVGPPIAIASIALGAQYDLSIRALVLTLLAVFGALLIEFFAQAPAGGGVGVVHQALRGAPHQMSAGPENVQRNGDGAERVERLPTRP